MDGIEQLIQSFQQIPDEQRQSILQKLARLDDCQLVPSQMQSESPELQSHTKCFRHNRPLVGFCKTCSRAVCESCDGCFEGHSVQSLVSILAQAQSSAASDKEVARVAAMAREQLDTIREAEQRALAACRASERSIDEANGSIARMQASLEEDVAEIEQLRRAQVEVLSRILTDVARDAIREARAALGVDATIRASVSTLIEKRDALSATHARQKAQHAHLEGRAARLRFVSGLSAFPEGEEGRRIVALVMRELDATFRPQRRPPSSAPAAPAAKVPTPAGGAVLQGTFEGAGDIPEVKRALAAKLLTLKGVQFGEPVPLDWLPAHDSRVAQVSVSPEGVLCVGGYDTRSLLVFDLPTRRQAKLDGGAHMFGCVFDGTLFVGWGGHAEICYAPVEDALRGAPVSGFARFPLYARPYVSPFLGAAHRGWIAISKHGEAMEGAVVDLAARSVCTTLPDRQLHTLGGFSGFRVPGALFVATNADATLLVLDGWKTRELCRKRLACPKVLPSATKPADLARAVIFDCNANFVYRKRVATLERPFRPYYQSLVRLYRDVFLCMDEISKKWVVARIVVP